MDYKTQCNSPTGMCDVLHSRALCVHPIHHAMLHHRNVANLGQLPAGAAQPNLRGYAGTNTPGLQQV